MLYLVVKTLHILSALLFLGAGLMTAYYKVRADRSGKLEVLTWYQREIVLADWIFTLPTVVIQPVTGIMLMSVTGFPFDSTWFLAVSGLYVIVTACWIPVVFIQVRLRDVTKPLRDGDALPPEYHRLFRRWVTLGFPAGISMAVIFALMVFKPWLA